MYLGEGRGRGLGADVHWGGAWEGTGHCYILERGGGEG
jgi:hypothetical protein